MALHTLIPVLSLDSFHSITIEVLLCEVQCFLNSRYDPNVAGACERFYVRRPVTPTYVFQFSFALPGKC
jgi:hypothetical protein